MKNNELLTLILEQLMKLNGAPKPDVLIPPAYVKTMLRNAGTCRHRLYSYESTRGNEVHKCFRDAGHSGSHNATVYSITVSWYEN